MDELAAGRVRLLDREVLVIGGEQDPIFPPRVLEQIASILPRDRFESIPGTGHSPYFEDPVAWNAAVGSFLAGQLRNALQLEPGARVHVLGIRFHPHAARCLLGAPMSETTGGKAPLEAVAPQLSQALEERLPETRSRRERFDTAADLLAGSLRFDRLDPVLEGLVEQMRSSRGAIPVARLAESAGLSVRQLQRRFRRDVGLGPKTLSRIFRFQGVFDRLAAGEPLAWASLAPACGYADQSHLIREFRAFAGRSPGTFFAEPPELAGHFVPVTEALR